MTSPRTSRRASLRLAAIPAAAALATAALVGLPTPASAQVFACPTPPVRCEIVDDRQVNIADRVISTLGEPSPLAFELRGSRARVVNTGIAELEGDGWFIGRNTNFGPPSSFFQLVNGDGDGGPGTLRLRSPGELGIAVGLRNLAGRVEVVSGQANVVSFFLEGGEVSIAPGAALVVGEMSFSGDRQIVNQGVLAIEGRLMNTPLPGSLDLGGGTTIIRGPSVTTAMGRSIVSSGLVVVDKPTEIQADLDLDRLTVVYDPRFAAGNTVWLNSSFGPRTARVRNLEVLAGVLRIGSGQTVEVSGDLSISGNVWVQNFDQGGIVMRNANPNAQPANLSFASAAFFDGTQASDFGRLTVARDTRVNGILPRGVINSGTMSFGVGAAPDAVTSRIVLGSFDNRNGTVWQRGGILDLVSNDGPLLEGRIKVDNGATLRLNQGGPNGAIYEFAELMNWNGQTGTLKDGSFRLNVAELRLPGNAQVLRNEATLEFVGNAWVASQQGAIREFDNVGSLRFEGGRDPIVGLRNRDTNSVATFQLPLQQNTIFELRNEGLLQVTGDRGQLFVQSLQSNPAGDPHTFGFRDGRLAGGRFAVAGGAEIVFGGTFGPVRSLASTVLLDGPRSRLVVASSGQSALAELAEIESAGGLFLFSGAEYSAVAPDFVNRGQLFIGAGSRFTASPSFEQRAGRLSVNGELNGNITWVAGELGGSGRINGSLFVPGVISGAPPVFIPMAGNPGMSAAGRMDDEPPPEPVPTGPLTISGAVELADTAVVAVAVPDDLSAMPVLAFGVEGGITLGGTLRVDFSGSGGFMQPAQLTFMQLVGNVVGQFAALEVIGGAGKVAGVSYALVFDDASGVTTGVLDVSPVPEPGTWALMLLGAAGIAARVRRPRPASPSGV